MAIPFVLPGQLPRAVQYLVEHFRDTDLLTPWQITLDAVSHFQHKDSASVYLQPDAISIARLRRIREKLQEIFNLPVAGDGVFHPHVTIGQASLDDSLLQLKEKAEILLPVTWPFNVLSIIAKNEFDEGRMEVFSAVPGNTIIPVPPAASQLSPPRCYVFSATTQEYQVYQPPPSVFHVEKFPARFTLSTYNILHSPLQPQTATSPRLPILLNTILKHPSTMILLQEVTDAGWKYFLSKPAVRQKYPYSSWPTHLPLPNERNIVFLSTIPFKARYMSLVTARKPALIVEFGEMVIGGVHLSAGLHEEKLALKLKELTKLTTFLQQQKRPFILAGDFNMPTHGREYTVALPKLEAILSEFFDAWKDFAGEGGETFDLERNWLAKESSRSMARQRHDRVYFERGRGISVERTGLFGVPEGDEQLGSDHWGLYVDFRIKGEEMEVGRKDISELTVPETSWTDDDLSTVLADVLPTKPDNEKLNAAVSLLTSILEPMRQQVQLQLQLVGSVALQAHTKSSDVDILAISTISQHLFWQLFLQHLQIYKTTTPENSVKLVRMIRDAKTPMAELLVNEQKIEMQYCPAGKLLPMSSPDIPD
jgi:2'-5' RNA ligase superfamily/Endonuclease/Exonuclease/phosphatase family